jgi:hypothetical protein
MTDYAVVNITSIEYLASKKHICVEIYDFIYIQLNNIIIHH